MVQNTERENHARGSNDLAFLPRSSSPDLLTHDTMFKTAGTTVIALVAHVHAMPILQSFFQERAVLLSWAHLDQS